MSECLSDDAIAALVEGRMSAEDSALVDRHMATCEACRSLVADTAKLTFETQESAGALPRPGDLVGRYRLLDILGVGGMGVVYAGEDPALGRKVAIKLIRTDLVTTSGSELKRRLELEARAMAKIAHPNVVAVHDIGTIGEHVFVAMEYVRGKTLREWLTSSHRTLPEILATFLAAGRGLAAAHAVGLVHRDFKPENVLCGDDGRVRVTDFGLARGDMRPSERALPAEARPPEGAATATTTRTGALVGTPAYMAPEQLGGGAADARSDQFSYSVALFEALYGARPFPAKDVRELATKIAGGAPSPPPQGGDPLLAAAHAILARGLRANPDERFESMPALLEELGALASPEPPPPAATTTPNRGRRVLFVLVALAVAAGGAAWAARLGRKTDDAKVTRAAGPDECTEGAGLYCDGHGVHGEERTLYRCEGGRVTTEKKCPVACVHLAGSGVDACDVEAGKCPIGNGVYCGGNHISADPKTLYRCSNGTVSVIATCPTRCVKEPNKVRDHCE